MKTDEEIMKGLDFCCNTHNCLNCPYLKVGMSCIGIMQSDVLTLIKKQQAKIERLKCEIDKLLPKDCSYAVQMEVSNNLETKIRAEAIKEFAERLKEMKYESIEWSHGKHPYVVEESDIDNLVEEMAGDK